MLATLIRDGVSTHVLREFLQGEGFAWQLGGYSYQPWVGIVRCQFRQGCESAIPLPSIQ